MRKRCALARTLDLKAEGDFYTNNPQQGWIQSLLGEISELMIS